MYSILGIITTTTLTTTLVNSLSPHKGHKILNSALLKAGQFQKQHPIKPSILAHLLPTYLSNDFIFRLNTSNDYPAYFQSYPQKVINFYGYIDNEYELREELIHLGYSTAVMGNSSEMIAQLVDYYLHIGMSATEINLLLMSRLQGHFALIILLSGQEDTLIAVSKGIHFSLASDLEVLYLCSCSQTLSNLVPEATLLAYEQPLHRLVLTANDYQKLMNQLHQRSWQRSPLSTATL